MSREKGSSQGGAFVTAVVTEPRTADFVNKLEVAFNFPSRNCAKAREETQRRCEEEDRGAAGALLNTSFASARKC